MSLFSSTPTPPPPPPVFSITSPTTWGYGISSAYTDTAAWVGDLWWPYDVLLAVAALVVLRMVVICLYCLPEWWAIGSFMGRRGAIASWRMARQRWADYLHRREWKHYARRSAESVKREIEAHRHKAEMQFAMSEILEHQAIRHGPMFGVMLRNRAAKRLLRRDALHARADHIAALLVKIEADKATAETRRTRSKAVRLVALLSSSFDRSAADALAELNKLAIEWDAVLPDTVPELVRIRLTKVLRLMAGASTVGEARAAKNQAESMLEQCGTSWEGLAA